MPTSYTSLLGLALPVTGELSGTWGDTVNDYITRYVDASVAGTQAISGSQTAVTLTVTNGTTLTQVGSGSSGSAQYAVINCTGNPAGLLTITAPASSRQYLIINATSTAQSVKIVGAGPTTGVTLVTGESAIVAWNGSDYVKVASSTADGVTTFSAGTTGFTPSTATSGAVTLAGTLATTNGGTGLTSFTANGVLYASSTSALTTGSALQYDGSNLFLNSGSNWATASGGLQFSMNGNDGYITTYYDTHTVTLGAGVSSKNQIKVSGSGGSNNINFKVNGSDAMALTSTGLGIGTATTTNGRLNVSAGTAATGNSAFFSNPDGTYNPYLQIQHSSAGVKLFNGSSFGAAANNLIFGNAGTAETMRIDGSGNLGLGVTPSAWNSSQWSVFEGAYGGALAFYKASNVPVTVLTSNAYNDGSWKYKTTDPALQYEMDGNVGIHKWYNAPSGTAGNTISFTQAMTLDATGRLLVGITSGNYALDVGDVSGGNMFRFARSGVELSSYISSGTPFFGTTSNTELALITNSTRRATIDTSGNLGLGNTSPASYNAAADNLVIGSSGSNGMTIVSGSANAGYIMFADGTVGQQAYEGQITYDHASNFMAFNTSATERARITSVGNMSLGGTADRGTTVGTNALQIFNGTAPAGTLTNGVSLYSSSGDLFFMDAAGNASRVGFRGVPQSGSAKTGSYTLATTDVGDYIQVGSGGSITIPDATFATGDVVSIFNNTTGNITITCSITTAYIAGTDSDKATMTLATRGVATVLFISSTICVVTGNVT
jgi:hypothetical protein